MTRLLLAAVAALGLFPGTPSAVHAQQARKNARPQTNRVYVKILVPLDPASRGSDQPVVESWIAEQLRKRGEAKFSAATGWVELTADADDSTSLWNGTLDGKSRACPVGAQILKRANGRIKILVDGWMPFPAGVTMALSDEPGSREVAVVEKARMVHGLPYVAILVGPPKAVDD